MCCLNDVFEKQPNFSQKNLKKRKSIRLIFFLIFSITLVSCTLYLYSIPPQSPKSKYTNKMYQQQNTLHPVKAGNLSSISPYEKQQRRQRNRQKQRQRRGVFAMDQMSDTATSNNVNSNTNSKKNRSGLPAYSNNNLAKTSSSFSHHQNQLVSQHHGLNQTSGGAPSSSSESSAPSSFVNKKQHLPNLNVADTNAKSNGIVRTRAVS